VISSVGVGQHNLHSASAMSELGRLARWFAVRFHIGVRPVRLGSTIENEPQTGKNIWRRRLWHPVRHPVHNHDELDQVPTNFTAHADLHFSASLERR
jgi:hypothetical protein